MRAALATILASFVAAASPNMGGRMRAARPNADEAFRLIVDAATTSTVRAAKGQAVSFTRATVALCVNASGTFSSLLSGEPCTSSGALRLEPVATNYILRSEEINDGYFNAGGATIVADQAAYMGRGTVMEKVTGTGGNQTRRNTVQTGAGPWVYSAYVASFSGAENKSIAMNCSTTGPPTGCSCARADGTACAVTTTGTTCYADSSFTTAIDRMWITGVCGGGETNVQVSLEAFTFAGGTTGNAYFSGLQVEAGTIPTTFQPTTSATSTRNAETATVATTGWPTGSGSARVDVALQNATPPASVYILDSRTAAASAGGIVMYVDTSRRLNCSTYDGTDTRNAQTAALTWTVGTTYKLRCEWDGVGVNVFRDGVNVKALTDATGIPTGHATNAYLGSDNAGANQLRGTIKNLCISSRLAGCQL